MGDSETPLLSPEQAEAKAKRWYAQHKATRYPWEELSASRRALMISVASKPKTDTLCMAPCCGGDCLRCFTG